MLHHLIIIIAASLILLYIHAYLSLRFMSGMPVSLAIISINILLYSISAISYNNISVNWYLQ